jgi:exopolysaccharide biosynthesis WecB/TagA/CpsF family protein
MKNNDKFGWPPKRNLLNVMVTPTTYAHALETIIAAAATREHACVDHMPVHVLIPAHTDKKFGDAMNSFDMVCPDGQPVRWGLNVLYKTNLRDRVYGPDLMLMLCNAAAEKGIGIYLYGSTDKVLEKLKNNLIAKYPVLKIVGAEAPPFRPLTAEEDEAVIQRINQSNAGLIFIGLGSPKQEMWAFEHREKIQGVQMCVGAAFDFHAGNKKQAPSWMQKRGLEWLFRLIQEPGRLWQRYLIMNSLFIFKFSCQFVSMKLQGFSK